MKKETKPKKKLRLHDNDSLPIPFVDIFQVNVRNDGITFINFYSELPSGALEQARIFTPVPKLKVFIDLVCKQLDYYPVKEEPERLGS